MEKEETINCNKKGCKGKSILIVILAILCVAFLSLFIITKVELNNADKCENVSNKVENNKEDNEVNNDKEDSEVNNDKEDNEVDNTEKYNGNDFNKNGSLNNKTITGNTEYQNYIKKLSSTSYYKVIDISDFYEIYVATQYYVGYDKKLYAVLEDEEKNTATIIEADDYYDGVKGHYTGIDNVIDIFHGELGNGGYDFLIVLRADGMLYFVNTEKDKNFALEKIENVKNVVNVYQTYDVYAHHLEATDIDGNITVIGLPKYMD